jgi:hypothetical protein
MRTAAATLSATVLLAAALPAPAAEAAADTATGPNYVAEAEPLVRELGNPRYAASRCLLRPVLAANGRTVILGGASTFLPGDELIAIDDLTVDPTVDAAVVHVLERLPPGREVNVRVRRAGSETLIMAKCADAKTYYGLLREGAAAAARHDAARCADRLDAAEQQHGLSAVWLRLSMSCKIHAGRLSGGPMWRADYELYRQRILEAQYSPALLGKLGAAIRSASHDLRSHGNPALGDALEADYGAALKTRGSAAADSD